MTILLVDDDLATARLYGAMIQKRGFQVRVCNEATDALEIVRVHHVRLILSDVEMPGMTGHEMAQRLLESGRKHCPILFLSAEDSVNSIANGLQCGGDDFLIKGDDINSIMDRIVFWLTSGFRSLPMAIRLNILNQLEEINPTLTLQDKMRVDKRKLRKAFEPLHREIQATPTGFGNRLVERILILGRAHALLLREFNEVGEKLRFPDAFSQLIRKLNMPWVSDVTVLLKHFDLLSRDKRFRDAADMDLPGLLAEIYKDDKSTV